MTKTQICIIHWIQSYIVNSRAGFLIFLFHNNHSYYFFNSSNEILILYSNKKENLHNYKDLSSRMVYSPFFWLCIIYTYILIIFQGNLCWRSWHRTSRLNNLSAEWNVGELPLVANRNPCNNSLCKIMNSVSYYKQMYQSESTIFCRKDKIQIFVDSA